jgi:hypothetical protein
MGKPSGEQRWQPASEKDAGHGDVGKAAARVLTSGGVEARLD